MDKSTFLEYISQIDNIDFEADSLLPNTYGCKLNIGGVIVPIWVFIPQKFPLHLPHFLLPKYDQLGFIPHVLPSGSVCYLEKESVFINIEQPEVVFQAALELAAQTLTDGIKGINHGDFREELHLYWERNRHRTKSDALSLFNIEDKPKTVQILKDQNRVIIVESGDNFEYYKNLFFKKSKPYSKSGLFVPLKHDCKIIPPRYEQAWNTVDLVDWLKPKISQENWKTIKDSLLAKNPSRFEYLVLSVPRQTGPPIFVGIQFKPKKDTTHPFLDSSVNWGVKLLPITRFDAQTMLSRGGADNNMQKKKVLLIGCGSVGSHFATMLAKLGVGELSLVDKDGFRLENIQRYTIGFQYAGKPKVEALREFIKDNYGFTKVTPYINTIEEFLDMGTDLNQYDLIVSATGDPTINLYLNKTIKESFPDLAFLIGWNEPMGIGGHAILSLPESNGCYRCLFRDNYNIASFAAKDQTKPFHVKHLGCGEVYTPYSALDSIRTSELMSRLSAKYLNCQIEKSQIISWKGDNEEFLKHGFNLSSRYIKQSQDKMDKERFEFIFDECPHCSKTK